MTSVKTCDCFSAFHKAPAVMKQLACSRRIIAYVQIKLNVSSNSIANILFKILFTSDYMHRCLKQKQLVGAWYTNTLRTPVSSCMMFLRGTMIVNLTDLLYRNRVSTGDDDLLIAGYIPNFLSPDLLS